MRVALHEMRTGVPVEVAIDEAVNLAKEYCGADAPGFVNGILGSAARELAGAAAVSAPRRPAGSRELAAKLAEISTRLRDPEVGDATRAELAREAAELVSQAGTRSTARCARRVPTRELRCASTRTTCGRWSRSTSSGLRFSERDATAGLDEAMRYSLLAGGKRIRPVLCLAAARAGGPRPGRGAARRRGDRADPHLLADPRRPSGDGRRRAAPRPSDLPRRLRRGRRDPRRRRPLRRGDPAVLRAPAGRARARVSRRSPSSRGRPGSGGWSAASTST